MGFLNKLKKAKQKYSAWENKRQAAELQKLKQARIREEGKAKLRALKAKEMKRIQKARGTGQSKGSMGFFGKVLENAAKADLTGTEKPIPKKKAKAKHKFKAYQVKGPYGKTHTVYKKVKVKTEKKPKKVNNPFGPGAFGGF